MSECGSAAPLTWKQAPSCLKRSFPDLRRLDASLERARKELQAVLEHQVLAPAQRQVLLHSLTDEVDVEPRESTKPPHDQVRIVAAEVVEGDGHLVCLPQHEIAPLVCCAPVLAREGVMIAHLVLVEWAVADVTFECPREIPLVVQRHHKALIVEQVVHAPPLQVEHLAHEPVHNVRAGVRLVWLVGEYWDVRHQLVPDRAGHMVRVELRFAPLLIVWRTQ